MEQATRGEDENTLRQREYSLAELGNALGLPVIGDGARVIQGVAPLEGGSPDTLCVVWDAKNLNQIDKRVPILGKPDFFEGRSGLVASDPRALLPALLKLFAPPRLALKGIHPSAVVSPRASISEGAWVGPLCLVEEDAVIEDGAQLMARVYVGPGARVGSGSVLEPQTALMAGTRVGKNCLLHAGCVLGCDGFGFLPSPSGIVKIPQIGNVVLGDDVEIGACSTVDRGTIGDTVIGDGTKIDNHVQIGHNARIGKHCIICPLTGIGGSAVVEDGVTISAQVAVTDHVRVGKGATLAGRSGVANDIPAGAVVWGFVARPHNEAKRSQILTTRLPELHDRIRRLERVNHLGPLSKEKEKQERKEKSERAENAGSED